MRTVLPFAVFFLFLGLWTWKLLHPYPVPEELTAGVSAPVKFVAAKALHVGGYAFLTVLTAFLPVRRPYFWMAVLTLVIHAVGTEIGQLYVPNRSGSVRDVLLNWAGILVGLAVIRVAATRSLRGGARAPVTPPSGRPSPPG
jgi:VanZ family protein